LIVKRQKFLMFNEFSVTIVVSLPTFQITIAANMATQHLKQSPPLKPEVKEHEKANPATVNLP
jgi:hypothetical protein